METHNEPQQFPRQPGRAAQPSAAAAAAAAPWPPLLRHGGCHQPLLAEGARVAAEETLGIISATRGIATTCPLRASAAPRASRRVPGWSAAPHAPGAKILDSKISA